MISRIAMSVGALVVVAFVISQQLSVAPAKMDRSVLLQKARQQMLSWNGFTIEMQEEADKALRLCDAGLLGTEIKCAHHVVSTDDSKWTHTEEGQNEWEETQRVMPRQVSVAPLGPTIGTPGDFGDRR